MKPQYGTPGKRHYPTKVTGYVKSIGFGATFSLYPVPTDNIPAHVDTLREVIRRAEQRAYEAGRRDAQADLRAALGLATDD